MHVVIPVYRGNAVLQECVQNFMVVFNPLHVRFTLVNTLGSDLYHNPWFVDYENITVVNEATRITVYEILNDHAKSAEVTLYTNERVRLTNINASNLNDPSKAYFGYNDYTKQFSTNIFALGRDYLSQHPLNEAFISPLYYEHDLLKRLVQDYTCIEPLSCAYHLRSWSPVYTTLAEDPRLQEELDTYVRIWGGKPGFETSL